MLINQMVWWVTWCINGLLMLYSWCIKGLCMAIHGVLMVYDWIRNGKVIWDDDIPNVESHKVHVPNHKPVI